MTKNQNDEFNKLVLDHMDIVYTTAIKLTGTSPGAEDLVQHTCSLAFNAFHTFDRKLNFGDWMRDICNKTYKS